MELNPVVVASVSFYIYIEREREREREYNKVKARFLVETFYSEFSPLRASSRPG